jgi:glycosyl transferase, family 25
MKVYVINLQQATERRGFQEKQMKQLRLEHEFIDAVSTTDISKDVYNKHYFDWQRPLREVEVACYYSHRRVWQLIIDNNTPSLILEDDALLSRHISKVLNALRKFNDADYIQLETRGRKKLISRKAVNITQGHQLHWLYLDRSGAAGYVLWPSGARKLLEHEKKTGISLTDAHITSCYNLVGFQLEPALIIQLDQCAHYKISSPFATHSQILDQPKPSHRNWVYFKFKRMAAQLGMATRQIKFFCQTNRREVFLIPGDFLK